MKVTGKMLLGFLILMLFNLSALPGYTYSKDEHHERKRSIEEKREERIVKIRQQLNLDPEQDKQLQALREEFKKQSQELKESMRAKRKELKKELQKEELSMERIHQLHAELKALLGQREDHRLKGILEARKILRPDQLTKFIELIGRDHHRSGKRPSG